MVIHIAFVDFVGVYGVIMWRYVESSMMPRLVSFLPSLKPLALLQECFVLFMVSSPGLVGLICFDLVQFGWLAGLFGCFLVSFFFSRCW